MSYWSRIFDLRRGLTAIMGAARSISFSQYSEDTLVYTLVPKRSGFYIDVGAYHPWRGSNTYKLYLRGWSGLTIEPNPDLAPLFRRLRPRDIHLTMGVAAEAQELEYFRFEKANLNSFDKDQAAAVGRRSTSSIKVACMPIQDIIDRHGGGRPIDLLSVDCEGYDRTVLESLDWSKNRPCVVVIEDFEQFQLNNEMKQSCIRSFLSARDYAVVSQGAFSFIYVDTTAFDIDRQSGFSLNHTQFGMLKRAARA
jgi:FkbM family methyltransferase